MEFAPEESGGPDWLGDIVVGGIILYVIEWPEDGEDDGDRPKILRYSHINIRRWNATPQMHRYITTISDDPDGSLSFWPATGCVIAAITAVPNNAEDAVGDDVVADAARGAGLPS